VAQAAYIGLLYIIALRYPDSVALPEYCPSHIYRLSRNTCLLPQPRRSRRISRREFLLLIPRTIQHPIRLRNPRRSHRKKQIKFRRPTCRKSLGEAVARADSNSSCCWSIAGAILKLRCTFQHLIHHRNPRRCHRKHH